MTIVAPAPMWTKEGRQDSSAWYRHMLEHEPVTYHSEIKAYGVFDYELIRKIFLDPATWSSARRFDSTPPGQKKLHILADTVAATDPPEHSRLRMLAMPSVAPKQMGAIEPHLREVIDTLLSDAIDRGTFDLVAEFAHKLPQMIINNILGIPPEDYEMAKGLSDRMEAATGRYTGAPMTDVAELRQVNDEYRQYFEPLIAARRKVDTGDVLSKLVQAEQDGDRLSTEELFKMAMIFNRAGAETTMTGIVNMIRGFMEYPGQYKKLTESPNLVASAVDEVLRFYPPTQSMSRVATRDVEIGNVMVPEGATMLLWLPAANRDPKVFDDPEVFDIERSPNRHVSFGYGIHVCIGLHLARLEMEGVLKQWLKRVATFERAETGPIDWNEISLVTMFPRSFPISITAKPGSPG